MECSSNVNGVRAVAATPLWTLRGDLMQRLPDQLEASNFVLWNGSDRSDRIKSIRDLAVEYVY
jgi:hypothetical protein